MLQQVCKERHRVPTQLELQLDSEASLPAARLLRVADFPSSPQLRVSKPSAGTFHDTPHSTERSHRMRAPPQMICVLTLLPRFPLQLPPPCSLTRLFKPVLPFRQRCSRRSRCPQRLSSICIPAVFQGLGTTGSPPGKETTNKLCLASLSEAGGTRSALLSCNAATAHSREGQGHAGVTDTLVTARLGLTAPSGCCRSLLWIVYPALGRQGASAIPRECMCAGGRQKFLPVQNQPA